MKQIYWTVGKYDIVTVIDAPDEQSFAAFGYALGSAGNVRTQTLRASRPRNEMQRDYRQTSIKRAIIRYASRFLSATLSQEVNMNTQANDSEHVRAFVQTAEQAGEYVWVITLVDFGAQKVKRAMVSDAHSPCALRLRMRARPI